ncbi:hypothetical protein E4U54_001003 [Claviceps lovelessii]|nr:hypothetical protein E4U54_001003 [Claviceps lovelessii]
MVSASHKRKVPPTTGPDPKRSKKSANPATGNKTNLRDGHDAKSRKISKTRAARPAGRVVLDASSLGWETVGDDFGALQVLSGVDVVKDGEKVQFIVKDDDATPTAPVAAESAAEGEAFEGFGDDVLEASGRDSRAGGDAEARVAVGGTEEESLAAASKRTTVVGPEHGERHEDGHKERAREKKKTNKQNGGKGKGGKMVVEETKDDDDNHDNHDDDAKMAGKAVKALKADAASRKSKQPCNQKKLSKSSSSQAKGNEFSALADMESDKAEDNDLDMAAWVALNLSPRLVSAIAKLGFAKPTAIQQQSIPAIVAGEDVIGKAQTGSGKTLAFGIPIVERWLDLHEGHMDMDVDVDADVDADVDVDVHDDEDDGEDQNPSRTTSTTTKTKDKKGQKPKKAPLAVILSPTRELAKQIGDHIKAVCEGLPTSSPYVCVVTGGLSIQKQQRQLEKADIVIGTPGRLWEVLDGDASLQEQFTKIHFLVIDEADRLFKVGQFKEAENIIGALDRQAPEQAYSDDSDSDSDPSARAHGKETRERQTLVFSATFDKDLQTKLAGKAKSSKSGDGAGAGEDEKMAYLMKCLKFRGEPTFIDVNPVGRMADNLREGLIECGAMEKVSPKKNE